ncbi:hypothetical protein [Hahella ganghwensis]|uniref:hypothetical protein n=1 Tax=Hahella ganghwensis TaxID=286420 RepID=UPI00037EB24A|nr:hypothetical protein [Hahella ganghwensis]
MSTEVTLSTYGKNLVADNIARELDGGNIKVYTASPGRTLLGTCPLSATSAPAAVNGLLTFNAITEDSSVDADGTAAEYDMCKSDDTVMWNGSVGLTASGESMTMDDTSLVTGGTLPISSATFQVP